MKEETVTLVTLVAGPIVASTVTAPVVELTEIDSKPFCDRTGPLNVVFAMIFPYKQVKRINLLVVSRDCLIRRRTPE
jgi:hypothetical protein